MRLSAIQLDVSHSEAPATRRERVVTLVRQLAPNCDFITLPELWETGAFDLDLGLEQVPDHDYEFEALAWLQDLQAIAGNTSTWIHAGSIIERGDGSQPRANDGPLYNSSILIDANGKIAATYRKVHLFGFDGGEAALLSAGDELVLVDTPLGRTGLATCYDVRFPELFRELLDLGAEAVLIPSGWPLGRISTWKTLAQARAIENQMWLIGTNETGIQYSTPAGDEPREIELGGATIVVSPAGKVVALGGKGEEVVTVDLDPGLTQEIRERFPILKDRRL